MQHNFDKGLSGKAIILVHCTAISNCTEGFFEISIGGINKYLYEAIKIFDRRKKKVSSGVKWKLDRGSEN